MAKRKTDKNNGKQLCTPKVLCNKAKVTKPSRVQNTDAIKLIKKGLVQILHDDSSSSAKKISKKGKKLSPKITITPLEPKKDSGCTQDKDSRCTKDNLQKNKKASKASSTKTKKLTEKGTQKKSNTNKSVNMLTSKIQSSSEGKEVVQNVEGTQKKKSNTKKSVNMLTSKIQSSSEGNEVEKPVKGTPKKSITKKPVKITSKSQSSSEGKEIVQPVEGTPKKSITKKPVKITSKSQSSSEGKEIVQPVEGTPKKSITKKPVKIRSKSQSSSEGKEIVQPVKGTKNKNITKKPVKNLTNKIQSSSGGKGNVQADEGTKKKSTKKPAKILTSKIQSSSEEKEIAQPIEGTKKKSTKKSAKILTSKIQSSSEEKEIAQPVEDEQVEENAESNTVAVEENSSGQGLVDVSSKNPDTASRCVEALELIGKDIDLGDEDMQILQETVQMLLMRKRENQVERKTNEDEKIGEVSEDTPGIPQENQVERSTDDDERMSEVSEDTPVIPQDDTEDIINCDKLTDTSDTSDHPRTESPDFQDETVKEDTYNDQVTTEAIKESSTVSLKTQESIDTNFHNMVSERHLETQSKSDLTHQDELLSEMDRFIDGPNNEESSAETKKKKIGLNSPVRSNKRKRVSRESDDQESQVETKKKKIGLCPPVRSNKIKRISGGSDYEESQVGLCPPVRSNKIKRISGGSDDEESQGRDHSPATSITSEFSSSSCQILEECRFRQPIVKLAKLNINYCQINYDKRVNGNNKAVQINTKKSEQLLKEDNRNNLSKVDTRINCQGSEKQVSVYKEHHISNSTDINKETRMTPFKMSSSTGRDDSSAASTTSETSSINSYQSLIEECLKRRPKIVLSKLENETKKGLVDVSSKNPDTASRCEEAGWKKDMDFDPSMNNEQTGGQSVEDMLEQSTNSNILTNSSSPKIDKKLIRPKLNRAALVKKHILNSKRKRQTISPENKSLDPNNSSEHNLLVSEMDEEMKFARRVVTINNNISKKPPVSSVSKPQTFEPLTRRPQPSQQPNSTRTVVNVNNISTKPPVSRVSKPQTSEPLIRRPQPSQQPNRELSQTRPSVQNSTSCTNNRIATVKGTAGNHKEWENLSSSRNQRKIITFCDGEESSSRITPAVNGLSKTVSSVSKPQTSEPLIRRPQPSQQLNRELSQTRPSVQNSTSCTNNRIATVRGTAGNHKECENLSSSRNQRKIITFCDGEESSSQITPAVNGLSKKSPLDHQFVIPKQVAKKPKQEVFPVTLELYNENRIIDDDVMTVLSLDVNPDLMNELGIFEEEERLPSDNTRFRKQNVLPKLPKNFKSTNNVKNMVKQFSANTNTKIQHRIQDAEKNTRTNEVIQLSLKTKRQRTNKFDIIDFEEEEEEEEEDMEMEVKRDDQETKTDQVENGKLHSSPNSVMNWINGNPGIESSRVTGNPNDSETKDILDGTAFNGYCVQYLRTSIHKTNHRCQRLHEVPAVLHLMSRWQPEIIDEINRLIKMILVEDFTNPPISFLSYSIHFCLLNSNMDNIIHIGRALVSITSGDGCIAEKSRQLWYCFISSCWESRLGPRVHKDFQIKELMFNSIFERLYLIATNKGHDTKVLFGLILQVLAEYAVLKPNIKLTICVSFLKTFKIDICPLNFKLEGIKQFLNTVNKDELRKYSKFCYKVYKTCFKVHEKWNALDIYKANPKLVEDFLEILSTTHDGIDKEVNGWFHYFDSQMQLFNTTATTTMSNSSGGEHEFLLPDNIDRTILQKPFSPQNFARVISNCKLNEKHKRKIFNAFRTIENGEKHLKDTLNISSTAVKQCLNDVTLSFMSLNAGKSRWNECHAFYMLLCDLNFPIVDFTGSRNTHAAIILLVTEMFLNLSRFDVNTAIDEFIGKKFYEEDSSMWTVESSPADKIFWERVCHQIGVALSKTSSSTSSRFSGLESILSNQKSLNKPIGIKDALDTAIADLLELRKQEEAMKLVKIVIDKNLLCEFKLSNPYLYRVLVIMFTQANETSYARNLMIKAKRRVLGYPANLSDKSTEIKIISGLTDEELYTITLCICHIWQTSSSENLRITLEEPTKIQRENFVRDISSYVDDIELDWNLEGTMERIVHHLNSFADKARFRISNSSLTPGYTENSILIERI